MLSCGIFFWSSGCQYPQPHPYAQRAEMSSKLPKSLLNTNTLVTVDIDNTWIDLLCNTTVITMCVVRLPLLIYYNYNYLYLVRLLLCLVRLLLCLVRLLLCVVRLLLCLVRLLLCVYKITTVCCKTATVDSELVQDTCSKFSYYIVSTCSTVCPPMQAKYINSSLLPTLSYHLC